MRMHSWLAVALLLLVSACSGIPDNAIVLVPEDGGSVGAATVSTRGGQAVLTQANTVVGIDDPARAPEAPRSVTESDIRNVFSGALGAQPRPVRIFIVNFVVGQAEMLPDSQPQLQESVAYIRGLSAVDVSVVGHADATGSAAVNRTLALQRAQNIQQALIAAGIDPRLMTIASYGSANPLVPTPQGVPEPRNRRVEITVR